MALQDYDIIRCVNYIRSAVAAGQDPRDGLRAAVADSSIQRPWADDRFLRPVLEDDALLFFDYDDIAEAMCALGVAIAHYGLRPQSPRFLTWPA